MDRGKLAVATATAVDRPALVILGLPDGMTHRMTRALTGHQRRYPLVNGVQVQLVLALPAGAFERDPSVLGGACSARPRGRRGATT